MVSTALNMREDFPVDFTSDSRREQALTNVLNELSNDIHKLLGLTVEETNHFV